MGRQAHLTRLALGMSPYEQPLRDIHGNLILGPYAHLNSDSDYVQDFDSRGHPSNTQSMQNAIKLRRAQNEVQEIAGVVKRGKEDQPSQWKSMKKSEKIELVQQENFLGVLLILLDRLLLSANSWWIRSFQYRFLTFASYMELPLINAMDSEARTFGYHAFLFAGLPLQILAGISQAIRTKLAVPEQFGNSLNVLQMYNHESNFVSAGKIIFYIIDFLWFSLEWPLHAFVTLQTLHLIPPDATPSVISLVPFTPSSPIQLPATTWNATFDQVVRSAKAIRTNPFALGYLRDRLFQYIQPRLHLILRQLTIKANRPDHISLDSNTSLESLNPDFPPTIGRVIGHRRYYGPEEVTDVIRIAFSSLTEPCLDLLRWLKIPVPARLGLRNDGVLYERSSTIYQRMLHNRQHTRPNGPTSHTRLRLHAVYLALMELHVRTDLEIDVEEMADRIESGVGTPNSTSTPDPHDLFDNFEALIDETNHDSNTNPPMMDRHDDPVLNGAGPPTSATLENGEENEQDQPETQQPDAFGTAVALQTLLEPLNNEQPLEPPIRTQTPIPGISRAASLAQVPSRPVRRPTDISQNLGNDSSRRRRSRTRRPRRHSIGRTTCYRVTTLSFHPADTFAYHTSILMTSLLMVPFDMLYLRCLAEGYLQSKSNLASESPSPLLNDLWPRRSWFGLGIGVLASSERWVFLGKYLTTVGIQSLVSFISWSGGVSLVLSLSKYVGWGEF